MRKNTLICILITLFTGAATAQTSWRGTVSTNWATVSNWTAGVPTATVDAVIGDANFIGSFQPSISTTAATCKSLTIGNSSVPSTLTIARNLTISGKILIGSNGTVLHNVPGIIALSGNWTNSGTYTPSITALVRFSGVTQSITGATVFKRLAILTGSTVTLASNITVDNSLNVSGTFAPTQFYTVSGTGNLIVNSGASIIVGAATFTTNYALSGIVTLNGLSTVDYASSTIDQNISNAFTYGYLRISGGMTKYLTGNLPPLNSTLASSGRILIAAGTLDMQTFTANRSNSTVGGFLTMAATAKLKIGGTNGLPSNYNTINTPSTSTVEYYGNNQVIAGVGYGNLVFGSSSGMAVKTMPTAAITIAGDFICSVGTGTGVTFTAGNKITVNNTITLGSGTTFNAGIYSHLFKGSWVNDGIFNGNTSTATFNGGNASLSGTGSNNFNNLVFSAAGINASGAASVNVSGNLSTTGSGVFTHSSGGTLTMTGAAKIITGSGINLYNLVINGTVTLNNALAVSGDFTVNGSFSGIANTVTMNGAAKTISGIGTIGFYGLSIQGSVSTSNSFSLSSNFTVAPGGSFNAIAGTATITGSGTLSGTANLYNFTINNGRTLTLGSTAILGIAGVFTKNGTLNVITNTTNTVNYNAAMSQTIVNTLYNNLILSNGGIKTAAAGFTINNDLTVNSGVTFASSSFAFTIRHNFTNNGILNSGISTINFTGNPASINGSATSAFYNLVMAAGSAISLNSPVAIKKDFTANGVFNSGVQRVNFTGNVSSVISGTASPILFADLEQSKTGSFTTLNTPVEVNGILTLTNGIIFSSATNLLTLDNNTTSTSGTSSSYIDGPIKKIGNQPFTFPVGNGGYFHPLTISSPVSATNDYTAQYFAANPDVFYSVNSKDLSLNHLSTCEYWNLERGDACPDVKVTLSWDVNSCGVDNLVDLRVAQWNGVLWKDFGNGGTSGSTTSGTVISSIDVTSYGPFTLGSPNSNNPLPIGLLNFRAIPNGNQVDISWSTVSEFANDYFTVEKSTNGLQFEKVTDKKGAGNSSALLEYRATDKNPASGTSYYRLKQTDFSGSFKYSNIASVTIADKFDYRIFPNPSHNSKTFVTVNGTTNEKIHLLLYDGLGNEMFSKSVILEHQGESTITIEPIHKLVSGIYTVVVLANETMYRHKLIIN
ncbi:MAG: T9SS type A sorting domain-containing protein [Bacteroidia bacterium]